MHEAQIEAMGPVDCLVMEWSGEQPLTGGLLGIVTEAEFAAQNARILGS